MITALDKAIAEKQHALEEWFRKQEAKLELPLYSSFDIRNSGFKSVVIDSNAFPSGFNNICEDSYPVAIAALKSFMKKNYPGVKSVAIISEITTNPYYYDNIITIKGLLEKSGYQVRIGSLEKPELIAHSFSKGDLALEQFTKAGNTLVLGDFTPDLLLSNNDFSTSDTSVLLNLTQPVIPNFNLGWYKRKKHHHFRIKNELIKEIAKILEIDRWLIGAYYEYTDEVNFKDKKNFDLIAQKIDSCIAQIQKKYDEYNIKDTPYVFVKGSASTYGMNAMPFHSGEEFLNINSRQRSTMGRSKGGNEVSEVLIQEGVPTRDIIDGKVAEPVVYAIGDQPVGGFFRTHQEKTEKENLNSRGQIFASDLFCPNAFKEKKILEGSNIPVEKIHVYNFLARLGVLAIAKELEELR
jgi:glutamate--cysteine ligase